MTQTATSRDAVLELLRRKGIDPKEALKQLDQELARQSLIEFGKRTFHEFKHPRHIDYIADVLERMERGEITHLAISAPPGHGKSSIMQMFVGWFVGRNPRRRVLSVSASEALAKRNSRMVRGIVQSEDWPWPDVQLVGESLEEWYTPQGGGVRTIGETGTVSGWRAEMMLFDDVQADAGTDMSRKNLGERFRDVFLTRLEPDGIAIIINCMTGDTPVRMADGSERRLDAVRPGDQVATYENGKLSTSRVLAWKNQGEDDVFELVTTNGNRVRANRRHPFLIKRAGITSWVRLGDLQLKDRIAALSAPQTDLKEFEWDEIVSITPAGRASVYDVQIERTENFIANGLVSHNTRWHDNDLIGQVTEGGTLWTYINFPAIALDNDILGRAEGEALWPARFPIEKFNILKSNPPDGMGAMSFAAQYQGDPVPAGGSTFQSAWLEHTYDELPKTSHMAIQVDHRDPLMQMIDPLAQARPAPPIAIQSVDSAWKTGTGNDFSVIATLTTDLRDIFVAHMTIGKWNYTELRRVVEQDYDRWLPRVIYVEEAASGYALVEELKHAPGKIIPVVAIKPGHDSKESRAESVTGWFEAGRVKFPKSAPWLSETIAQLKRFPFGKHDDCVDALVRGVMQMQQIIAAENIKQRRRQQDAGLTDAGDFMSR